MNAQRIVTPQISIAETVFAAVENQLPDDDAEFQAVMRQVRPLLPAELFFDLELAANLRVGQAMEDGFLAGWNLRGKV